MKYLNLLLFAFLLAFTACGEKENLDMATVIQDCNGVFIKMDNTYYEVCNEELLATVEGGTELNLNVTILDECNKTAERMCLVAFPHEVEGVVKVNYVY